MIAEKFFCFQRHISAQKPTYGVKAICRNFRKGGKASGKHFGETFFRNVRGYAVVHMDDSAILDLFFARDESAIKMTGEKYGATLQSISRNITGSREDAEECVNDTYLAAWNNIPPTRPAKYDVYLYRIVRNISYDVLDKRMTQKRRGNVVSLTDEMEEMIPGQDIPFEDHVALRVIENFLQGLSTADRLLFVRRYFYGDSVASMSALSGIRENTIAVRLMRLRKKLREMLKKEEIEV